MEESRPERHCSLLRESSSLHANWLGLSEITELKITLPQDRSTGSSRAAAGNTLAIGFHHWRKMLYFNKI